jgi:hypothetical protein
VIHSNDVSTNDVAVSDGANAFCVADDLWWSRRFEVCEVHPAEAGIRTSTAVVTKCEHTVVPSLEALLYRIVVTVNVQQFSCGSLDNIVYVFHIERLVLSSVAVGILVPLKGGCDGSFAGSFNELTPICRVKTGGIRIWPSDR